MFGEFTDRIQTQIIIQSIIIYLIYNNNLFVFFNCDAQSYAPPTSAYKTLAIQGYTDTKMAI